MKNRRKGSGHEAEEMSSCFSHGRPTWLEPVEAALVRFARGKNDAPCRLAPYELAEAHQNISSETGLSVESIRRYVSIILGPMELRKLYEDRKVKLVIAARLARLEEPERTQLLNELAGGAEPTVAFEKVLGPPPAKSRSTAVSDFLRQLDKANAAAEGHDFATYTGVLRKERRRVLVRSGRIISELLKASEAAAKRREAELAKLKSARDHL